MKTNRLFIVVFVYLFISLFNCKIDGPQPDPGDPPPPKVIDPVLIGGYWLQVFRYYDNYRHFYDYYFNNETNEYPINYYKIIFTEKTYTERHDYWDGDTSNYSETTIKAYSKDDCIYSFEDDVLLFNYITSAYPPYLDDDTKYLSDKGMQGYLSQFFELQKDARQGRIISITLPGSSEPSYYLRSTSRLIDGN